MDGTDLEIDHILVFVSEDAPEAERLKDIGLTESYRRVHPGQGTRNICYCFDNAYLELLWINRDDPVSRDAVKKMQLAERADWRTSGCNPFGFALRPVEEGASTLPIPFWNYHAPYMPEDMSIPVADLSDDLNHPLIFRSPGKRKPADRIDERQQASGLHRIGRPVLFQPRGQAPAQDMFAFEGLLEIRQQGSRHILTVPLLDHDGEPVHCLHFPDFEIT